MTSEYKVSADQGFTRVTYIGKVAYDTSTSMMRDLAEIAHQGNQKFLVDLRNAQPTYSHVTPIQHIEEASNMGLPRTNRTALLGAEKDRTLLQYVENVSVNRGYLIKAFFDENEAVKWLREEA
jgi:phosphoribosyl 1,2-cyclic phosphodiesterase